MGMGRLRSALAAAGMFATLGLAESASAATYTVNDADDVADAVPNDGVCDAAGPDGCTLRAAVQTAAAVGSSGDDVVELPFDVTLTLGAELSASGNGNLTIRGTGVGRQEIDAADASRVLQASTIDVTLEDLLLSDGEAEHASEFRGGAIHFSADDDDVLHLENTRVESSESVPTVAAQAQGGGIYVTGDQPTLSLAGSEVVGNTAGDGTHSGVGGGIAIGGANVPTVVASNSLIDSNVAVGGAPDALGGGLYVSGNAGTAPFGSVTLTNSTVSENSAGGAGTSTVARGGGIYLDGAFGAPDLSLLGTTGIEDNEAGGGSGDALGEGGGVTVDEDGGTVTLSGATIQNNSAGGADELADGEGSGRGGGLYSLSAVDATDATFLNNEAGVRSSIPEWTTPSAAAAESLSTTRRASSASATACSRATAPARAPRRTPTAARSGPRWTARWRSPDRASCSTRPAAPAAPSAASATRPRAIPTRSATRALSRTARAATAPACTRPPTAP